MKTNIVINKLVKYDKIYHISDIHIRNTEEHIKIYSHVFENLYKYLLDVKSEKSLIVITGDILHNKDKLTTISETLCVDFLEKLSSLMTTIIIPGNHDFNEKANTKEDSLSTILYKRPFNNLYYLKYSGVYKFNNILFGFSSLIDNKFVKALDISDDGIKIGLYHGAVANSKNSQGFEFSKNSITNFDDYDFVLLGDIHYYQYLNEEKTIAYASSLISQNFSETDLYHGVLVWDLKNKSSSYKIIHNDYRYEELDIKNNKILYQNKQTTVENLELSPNGKLRINIMNTEQDFYNKTVFNIKAKYPNINIVHNKILSKTQQQIDKTTVNNKISLQSVVDNEIQKLPEESRKFIEKVLLKEIKSAIQTVDEKLNWRLLSLEFSNMFSYGPNNVIDFTKLTFDEITGLFGPNSIGKSSLIDILLFSLFDDYSRNYQDKHKSQNSTIINTKEKTFTCKVSFCIDNTVYFIEKEGLRLAPKTEYTTGTFKPTKYDFYKMESDKKIQLNGQDRVQTLNRITKLIGSYNDFCISSVCLQNNLRDKIDFFNMSPTEKKKFLNDRLNFDIFKNIEDKYKDLLKENKINIKHIEKTEEYINYNHNIDTQIKQTSEALIIFEQSKFDLDNQLKNNNDELSQLYEKLKHVDDDIDSFLSDKKEINNDINVIQQKLDKYKDTNLDDKIEQLHENNLKLSSKLKISNSKYNLEDLNKYKNNYTHFITTIESKINKLYLIKNQKTINSKNQKFEKQKLEKIIEIKSRIFSDSKLLSKNKFSENIIDSLKYIFNQTQIHQIQNQINDTNLNISNLENNINSIMISIKYIENILIKYDGISYNDYTINIYNNINYDDYYDMMTNIQQEYNKYYELYKVIETNNDIFKLLKDFNNCINIDCSNCLHHYDNINKLFTNYDIHEDLSIIKYKYEQLHKNKIEFHQIIVYHYTIKLNNFKTLLQLFNSMLEHEKNKLAQIIEQSNDSTIISFKNDIQEKITKFEQHNLLIQLEQLLNSTNEEYILLNQQLEEFTELSEELKQYKDKLTEVKFNIDNYEKDTILLKQIDNNKNTIQDLKLKKNKLRTYNLELSKLNYTLQNIYNSEYNSKLYLHINNVKKNIQTITNNIISVNNKINENKQLLLKINNNKNKYNKLSEELCKFNELNDIYENIIKITGPKGIPRQIINIKLLHVENIVNDIIYPFINKDIVITKDIEDIKVLINDGTRKYYNCGGMENFIIAMAFKIAFTYTFNIPQSGILIIDEGVSVLDKEHIRHFDIISNFIKQYYNHIILITHIDAFYDYTFDVITITQNKYKQSIVIFSSETINYSYENKTEIIKQKMKQPTKTMKKIPLELDV